MGNGTGRSDRRRRLAFALCLLGGLGGWGGSVSAEACRADSVSLRGDWGVTRFTVELADDPNEQARGLMHRTEMASGAGMLFVYDRPARLSFWMRNTLIPLDMLFIDPDGVVRHVHHMATPLDETPIHGGDGLLAVLEINGGLARRLGIGPGTQVRHPAFDSPRARWPC